MIKILLVEDQLQSRELLSDFLRTKGYDVHDFDNAEDAFEYFEKTGTDCAVLDINLPRMTGIDLLKKLRTIDPYMPAIIMTAFGSVNSAVDGMKAGASHYIEKPIDLKKLLSLIELCTQDRQEKLESREIEKTVPFSMKDEITALSMSMKRVLSVVQRIAKTDVPVLLSGETGTGKEVIARAIHTYSVRSKGSFIALNCAALPENLVEAELFGYESGAFSGARERKKGLAEIADNGTLFLDELGEFPMTLQAKLLRMMDGYGFYRVGGSQLINPNIRIIAATNKNLVTESEKGNFREDLYYRMKGVEIRIPPLRERAEDILPLAKVFLEYYAKKYDREITGFERETCDRILRAPWKGNVRELQRCIESAVVLTRKSLITPDDMGFIGSSQDYSSDVIKPETEEELILANVEKEHIRKVLALCNGNISKTASALGIHRNTLSTKIKEYGLSTEDL
jgi:DNA-binding NtrC family response regulator